MQTPARPLNRNKVNLAIDIGIFGAFLAATAPKLTGLAIHEWLSIGFGVAIITHLLLHWQWIVEVTKRFFSKAQMSARVNYVLNTLLFIIFTLIIFSGLMISEVALPLFGIQATPGFTWRSIHKLSADASVFLLGLHVALHWKWIVNAVKRFVITPIWSRRPALKPTAALTQNHQEA